MCGLSTSECAPQNALHFWYGICLLFLRSSLLSSCAMSHKTQHKMNIICWRCKVWCRISIFYLSGPGSSVWVPPVLTVTGHRPHCKHCHLAMGFNSNPVSVIMTRYLWFWFMLQKLLKCLRDFVLRNVSEASDICLMVFVGRKTFLLL